MKIEKLSDCSVKITLTKKDMSEFGIEYDGWDSDTAAEFLLTVSEDIRAKTGTDITREKLYVEIFSRISGCMIFVSFPKRSGHRRSRRCRLACSFTDYGSLRNFCRELCVNLNGMIGPSRLYYSGDLLRLELEVPAACRDVIEESAGFLTDCSELSDGVVSEYYICAESENAAEKIAGMYTN